MSRWTLLCVLCLIITSPGIVRALDASVAVEHEAEYTTNSGRTATNELEEWVNTPSLSVGAQHAGTAAELDLDSRYEHRFYQQNLFDDGDALTGSTNLVWHALPERLDFTVINTRTESTARAIAAFTEDNRQETMITQAGPTLRFRTRGRDELQFQYVYGDVHASETDTDSVRHTGIVRYIIQSSATRSFTIEAINNQVQFENPIAPDIDAWTGQVTWAQQSGATEISLTGGYTSMSRTLNRNDLDRPLVDLELTWDVRPNTQLGLSGAYEIRDQANSLTGGTGYTRPTDSDINEVFTNRRGEISLTQAFGRTDVTLFARYYDEDYEEALRDNESQGVGLRLARQLTPRTSFSLDAEFTNRDFSDQGDDQDEIRAGMGLVWQAGRRLTFTLGVRYEDRESDSIFRTYDELIGSISIYYRLLGAEPTGA